MAAEDYIDFDFFEDEDRAEYRPTCRYCKCPNLMWLNEGRFGWTLIHENGKTHKCSRYIKEQEDAAMQAMLKKVFGLDQKQYDNY